MPKANLADAAKAMRARKERKRRGTGLKYLLDGPTPESARKGDARRISILHGETRKGATPMSVAYDPIIKWERKGKLTPTQVQTINRMQELWEVVYGEISMTAAYSEPLGARSSNHGGEGAFDHKEGSRALIRAIEGQYTGRRERWYICFEKICRFLACPVDVASSRDEALTVVKMVADEIAEKGLI